MMIEKEPTVYNSPSPTRRSQLPLAAVLILTIAWISSVGANSATRIYRFRLFTSLIDSSNGVGGQRGAFREGQRAHPASVKLEQSIAQKNDQALLIRIVGELLKAQETNDFSSYIKLWSQSSPLYRQLQERMPNQLATNKYAFGQPSFSRILIADNKASLRLSVDLRTSGPADREPLNQRIFQNFSFAREEAGWRIWSRTNAQADVALALTQAKSDEERAVLLKQEVELVNIYLIQSLLDLGRREFYEDPRRAATAFRLSHEVAELLDRKQSTAATKATVATTLHNLANVERAMGNYGKVLEYEEKALALSARNDLRVDALINIGITHALQNNYDFSLKSLQSALVSAKAITNEVHRNRLIGLIYDSIGNVHTLQGNFAEALADYQSSMDYRKDPLEKADTMVNMGIVLERQGDLRGAEERYRASLAVFEGKNTIGTTTVLNNLASVQLKKGNYQDSIGNAKRASVLARQIRMPELQWRSYLIESKARRVLREVPEARQLLDESIAVVESMRGLAAGGSEERQRFLEDKTEPYYVMIDLLMKDGNEREAFRYVERAKAKVLLDVLSTGRGLLSRLISEDEQRQEQSFLVQLAAMKEKIRQAQLNSSVSNSELSSLLDQRRITNERYSNFLAGLYTKYPGLKTQRGEAPLIELDETAKFLPNEQSAVLQFSVGEDATYLFVITRRTGPPAVDLATHRIDIKRDTLKSLVESFRNEINNEGPDFRQPSSNLYTRLLGQARERLTGKNTLIIVPDGPLWELPFQALQVRNNRYLIEDSAIFYAPSLTALREMAERRKTNETADPSTLFALINPLISDELAQQVQTARMGTSLTSFPEPTKQIKTLREIYGAPPRSVIHKGVDASEKRFREEAGSYQILYVFAHGVLNNQHPLRSYVVLTPTRANSDEENGLLEAAELMRMSLKADLAILAACNTARGQFGAGEGMIGLAWALFVAGCPAVVVSQWSVPPASTQDLMLSFHRNLMKGRTGGNSRGKRAQALQQASLSTKRSRAHPLYWAGFVLVGDGM